MGRAKIKVRNDWTPKPGPNLFFEQQQKQQQEAEDIIFESHVGTGTYPPTDQGRV